MPPTFPPVGAIERKHDRHFSTCSFSSISTQDSEVQFAGTRLAPSLRPSPTTPDGALGPTGRKDGQRQAVLGGQEPFSVAKPCSNVLNLN